MGKFFRIRLLVVVALVVQLLGTAAASASAPKKVALLGIYYGSQGTRMQDVQALESWQGKSYAVLNMFTSWDPGVEAGLFTAQLPAIWQNGNIPMITWEPYTDGGSSPSDIEVRIARGDFDSYLTGWATQLKVFLAGPDDLYGTADDRRAYLRFAHEMNANWYPWSAADGNNRPSDYVSMWRRVHSIFTAIGLDSARLEWVWSPNRSDVGGYRAESFYPGNAYVDWVAIDGYNRPPPEQAKRRAPSQVFDSMLKRIRRISPRPSAIAETATSSSGVDGLTYKNNWIRSLYKYALDKNVKMVAWFNQDKSGDWAVFGGSKGDVQVGDYQAFSSYRAAVAGPGLIGSDRRNPRLIDDASFRGAPHR